MRRPPTASREKRLIADLKQHEGTWRGTGFEVGAEGEATARFGTSVVCAFPRSGPYAYRQESTYAWPDGREETGVIGGILDGGKLRFDTEDFRGEAWSRDGVVFLDTARKDAPGLSVREVVFLGTGGLWRSRTAHWFEDGRCLRRTVCDERMI